jgi:hypothetical protein
VGKTVQCVAVVSGMPSAINMIGSLCSLYVRCVVLVVGFLRAE